MQRTKRITIYQHAYTQVEVEREITIDVPVWLETKDISEEQLQAIIDEAIDAGLVPESLADWHSDEDYSLVDEQEVTSEIVAVVWDKSDEIGVQTDFRSEQ